MPNDTASLARLTTLQFPVKVTQGGSVVTPPATIPSSVSPSNVASLTRQVDAGGRAVYRLTGNAEGTATATIGSGSGALVIDVTVTPAIPVPLVFERDGDYVQV